MNARSTIAAWPPTVGDYARVGHDEVLAEVLDITDMRQDRWYALNILAPHETGLPIVRLEDLAPVWHGDEPPAGHAVAPDSPCVVPVPFEPCGEPASAREVALAEYLRYFDSVCAS